MNEIARRNVLTAPALLGTASLIGTSHLWAGANDRIRVASVGLGGRGGELMKQAFKIPNVEVTAVCDPDNERMRQWAAEVEKIGGRQPRQEADLRRLLEDKDIDAINIATCNHWHAPAAIFACQAGKHVYVEKPVSHNVWEGRKMVQAARKYKRIVQGGLQRRSNPYVRRAVELLREGVIGDVYMARALVFGDRKSIGFQQPEVPPPNLNWELWLGPAPPQPFHRNLVHYNWHWFWDFGNGELGNNGSHQLDVARWGLNKGLPSTVQSTGGRFGYKDQGQTPNTQIATFGYQDGTQMVCETRGLFTNDEGGVTWGVHFYGSNGYLSVNADGKYKVYLGRNKQPEPDMGKTAAVDHYGNFIEAVRAGDRGLQTAEIEESYLSCALCHLGNIAHRLQRKLVFDAGVERFVGDAEANTLLTRIYRKPFVVTEHV
jgi:predicted dehydrogenase